MTDTASWFSTNAYGNSANLVQSLEGTAALRIVACEIEGVHSVRVLNASDRAPNARDKVYVVLATHDVKRDRRIVEVLCQLDGIDFDLVPSLSEDMIPSAAVALRPLS
jgi:hypothetical protein